MGEGFELPNEFQDKRATKRLMPGLSPMTATGRQSPGDRAARRDALGAANRKELRKDERESWYATERTPDPDEMAQRKRTKTSPK